MPPEIEQATGVHIPTLKRDPHYFLPTVDGRYLLFGSNEDEMKQQFFKFFSEADWRADRAMNKEIGQIRDDIGKSVGKCARIVFARDRDDNCSCRRTRSGSKSR